MDTPHRNRRWWGWGDTGHRYPETAAHTFLSAISRELGLSSLPKTPPVSIAAIELPAARLPEGFIAQWRGKGLSSEKWDRLCHAGGKSYRDLVRFRSGKFDRYPDGVLYLEQKEDLPALFKAATDYDLTLIPFGGGTGVVGGTECLTKANRPVVVVNLCALNRLISIDEISMTATSEAGILGPQLEALLNSRGYTLGHFPQSFEFSTLGGWVVTRSAGQNSTKYGKIEKLTVSFECYTPKGVVAIHPVPASASGPSLKELLIGSEGIYGIVTEVTVRISKQPVTDRFVTAVFKDFASGMRAIRTLIQTGLKPSIIRLSDAPETQLLSEAQGSSVWQRRYLSFFYRLKRLGKAPCVMMIGVEGAPDDVEFQSTQIRRIIKRSGGASVPKDMGKTWKAHRFALPYLRDDLMDHGLFIDTLETAAEWSAIEELYGAMTLAFAEREKESGEKLILGCHLSHAYPDGASLYFTLITRQKETEALAQWHDIKTTATNVISGQKAALSHHHGIGCDHRAWMTAEHGVLGMDVLSTVKAHFDPEGRLNPGKLV